MKRTSSAVVWVTFSLIALALTMIPSILSAQGKVEKSPKALVDINTADQKTLETLPGVGPALAQEIIKGRPYKSIEDLGNVKGIGKAKLDALRGKITVGPVSTMTASSPSSAPAPPPSVPPAGEKVAPAKAPSA